MHWIICAYILGVVFNSHAISSYEIYNWAVQTPTYPSEGHHLTSGFDIVLEEMVNVGLETQCGYACQLKPGCESFNFHASEQRCQLISASHLNSSTQLISHDGWDYFTKETFQIPQVAFGACYTSPCQNGGACIDHQVSDPGYVCLCNPHFSGINCQTQILSPEWSAWTALSSCSATCGQGVQNRTRVCTNLIDSSLLPNEQCAGPPVEMNTCMVKECPSWDTWSSWGPCSTQSTCGRGSHVRQRQCSNGGQPDVDPLCAGSLQEMKPCSSVSCLITMAPIQLVGVFGEGNLQIYNNWSQTWGYVCADNFTQTAANLVCSSLALGAVVSYVPSKNLPTNPIYFISSVKCYGNETTLQQCPHSQWSTDTVCNSAPAYVTCKVNGQWSLWSVWSTCSVTCGTGTKSRVRSCTNPPPTNGGTACIGEEVQSLPCTMASCT